MPPEAAVRKLLVTAEFLTEKLPQTWKTYQSGLIDRERATKAAQAVEDIAHREDLPEWLIETRPPPDWVAGGAA